MNPMTRARLAVICDYAEERWPSMDLVAEMLCAELKARHSESFEVTRVQPRFVRRLSRAAAAGDRAGNSRVRTALFNADRALNRFVDYPRALRRRRNDFDLFHIVDHSYGHLALELDRARTVVTCHDLDAFACLLASDGGGRRSLPLRLMARRTLAGMRRAARVCCPSAATRDALAAAALVAPERVAVIPNGVHPAYSPQPDPAADAAVARLLGTADPSAIEILHVGSTIARKRIDLLLHILARVRARFPAVRLVKAGGAFTADQLALADALGVRGAIVAIPFVEPPMLAAVYRRCALALLPSDSEGFGLPLIEAMACGTPAIGSAIAMLREVGGDAAVYCAAGDAPAWSATIGSMLRERAADPTRWAGRRAAAVARAGSFSWSAYADRCAAVYRELADGRQGEAR